MEDKTKIGDGENSHQRQSKFAEARKAAFFLLKRVGPTAAMLILRQLGKIRLSNAMGFVTFTWSVYQEWKAKDAKRDCGKEEHDNSDSLYPERT